MNKIAVIGSLNVDFVSFVDHAPESGETIISVRTDVVPGGKGANQAFALGRMGASVTMFGAVGNDSNAAVEINNLKSVDVNIKNILSTDEPTGTAYITVDAKGTNRIIVNQGANKLVTRAYIDSVLQEILENDLIIFQLEIPLDTVIYATDILKSHGKKIILDPAPAPGPLPKELLRNIDIIKPNENELAKLTGYSNHDITNQLDTACQALLDNGVGCVLASLGSSGVFVKQDSETGRIFEVENVKVVDSTAAGDSFTAAVCFALANSQSISEAVIFANLVSTIVVQREGAQKSIPSSSEIKALWNSIFKPLN